MPDTATFQQQQREVAVRMAAAVAVTIFVIGAALYAGRGNSVPFSERLATALQADLLVVIWLFVSIANVARLRFFSRDDIAGSAGTEASDAVRNGNAVLHNTLEQVVLAVVAHLGLAAALARSGPLIIALVVLFGLGRALFWAGYAKGAPARALGFALTFYPSAFALLIAIAVTLARLAGGI